MKKVKINDIIQCILNERRMTKKSLAGKIGMSPQLMNDRLHHTESIGIDSVIQLLSGAGYKLIAVPNDVDLPVNAYEVTSGKQSEPKKKLKKYRAVLAKRGTMIAYSDSVHAFTPEDAVKMIIEKYSLENSNEEVADLLENLEEMSE